MTFAQLLSQLRLAPAPYPTLTLPSQQNVAAHFHLTEVGIEARDFLDCGGIRRQKSAAVLQILVANDTEHRLPTTKLLKILEGAQSQIPEIKEAQVEIELTGERSVERYQLNSIRPVLQFELASMATACLAPDTCNLDPVEAQASQVATGSCSPQSSCC